MFYAKVSLKFNLTLGSIQTSISGYGKIAGKIALVTFITVMAEKMSIQINSM